MRLERSVTALVEIEGVGLEAHADKEINLAVRAGAGLSVDSGLAQPFDEGPCEYHL
jgi:hypothetical protein